MKYLIDTHVLLWSLFSPKQLPEKVQAILMDLQNEIFVSVISFWEISIKYSLGKLSLQGVKPDELPGFLHEAGFEVVNIDETVAATFYQLPRGDNADPFDRLIVWQAIHNDMILLSKDNRMATYSKNGLKHRWD
jgi:PIN domain nuclease of toxin-antitoxin system